MTNPFPGYDWILDDTETYYHSESTMNMDIERYLQKAPKWWPATIIDDLEQMLIEHQIKFFSNDNLEFLAAQIMNSTWLIEALVWYSPNSKKYHRRAIHVYLVKLLKRVKVDQLMAGDNSLLVR